MHTFSAEVIKKEFLTENIVQLMTTIPVEAEPLAFNPGQFTQFLIGEKIFRSYSIVSLPSELPQVTFCIKLEDGGVGSEYVQALAVGDMIPMRGPLGNFVIRDPQTPMVFVANGVGIAPFYSMIPDLLEKNPNAHASLIFGVRSEQDAFYYDRFIALAQSHPHFSFVPTLSRPEQAWSGYAGRVTSYVTEHYDQHRDALFYLCGSLSMVQDVRAILMQNGHPTDKIKLEIFT